MYSSVLEEVESYSISSNNNNLVNNDLKFATSRSTSQQQPRTIQCQNDYDSTEAFNGTVDYETEPNKGDEFSFDEYGDAEENIIFPKKFVTSCNIYFFSGTGLPMIFPGPQHTFAVPDKLEDLADVQPGMVAKMMIHDAQRGANPSALLNRVVYDCIDPSPMPGNNAMEYTLPSEEDKKGVFPFLPQTHKQRLRPYYTPLGPDDTTLVFESRFESGNLRRAIQVFVFWKLIFF